VPKEPWEWDEADLQQLIHQKVDESLELEYKSSDALGSTDRKKNEISKDVSAFANSTGGTIVYGIRESNGRPPRVPQDLDGIDPAAFSKEWLEQVINSRIHPRIDGLRINPISLSNSLADKTAYVVSIPQGTTAHQASDHRYYKRFNFESVPMEHYEVMLVLNRIVHPKVIAVVSARDRTPAQGYDAQKRAIAQLDIRLRNVGTRLAEKVAVQFWIPEGYNARGGQLAQAEVGLIEKNGVWHRTFIYYHRQPDGIYPLFPNAEQKVFDDNRFYISLYLFEKKEADSKSVYISWQVYADNAAPEEGKISMYELFFPEASAVS
jgi:hypothetical protein